MAPSIEFVRLAVTFTVPGDDTVPDYRDTLFDIELSDELRTQILAEARPAIDAAIEARHGAWAEQIRNPPPPEPVPVQSADDVLAQASAALQNAREANDQAQAAIEAVQAQQAQAADAVVEAPPPVEG